MVMLLIVVAVTTFVVVAVLLVRGVRRERRATRAFLAQLERMGKRCPACQPWGGFILGRMKPGGGYEVHTCDVCGGTGELP